jgi:hypothetical protein
MTLSATAIINGLTLLRAYGCVDRVCCAGADEPSHDTCGDLLVYVNKPREDMHEDDQRRMVSEGWEWGASGYWRLYEE